MEQQIHITLHFDLATGKVNLNEIVYRLEQLKNPLMLRILKEILTSYDDLISERLTATTAVFFRPARCVRASGATFAKGIARAVFAAAAASEKGAIARSHGACPLFLANLSCPCGWPNATGVGLDIHPYWMP